MLSHLRKTLLLRLAILALVELGIGLAVLASASPDLHKYVHHDADHAEHQCLVTALESGGVDSAPVVMVAVQPPAVTPTELIVSAGIATRSYYLECSIFEHGPPVLS